RMLYVDDAIANALNSRIDGARRDAFITQWAGTDAAQFADIERRLSPPVTNEALDSMEAFARSRVGTDVGARAWAELAIVLSSGEIAIDGSPAHGSDPTERYLRLIKVANALQAAHAPSNEWVQRAPGLVGRFFVLMPKFGPAGPDRLLAAYRDFVIRQIPPPGAPDVDLGGITFGTSHTLPSLLSDSRVDALLAMESLFDEVERSVANKSVVRFLRAGFYEYWSGTGSDAPRPAVEAKARATLLALAGETAGQYPRRALAHLAARLFTGGEYALARTQLLTYVERYPASDWAWVAAVHAGQCSERLQEWQRAGDEYRQAATRYSSNPLARVLGLTYAARVSGKMGATARALTEYRAARKAWNPAYGASYTVGDPFSTRDPWKVTRGALDSRIAKLAGGQ
ncbi:MAG TPA: hypothetical protein VKI43_16605, partial [Vicinamibacterales bacterium]|nr:hypothetical protein [Vicinamibacterales bacterium]